MENENTSVSADAEDISGAETEAEDIADNDGIDNDDIDAEGGDEYDDDYDDSEEGFTDEEFDHDENGDVIIPDIELSYDESTENGGEESNGDGEAHETSGEGDGSAREAAPTAARPPTKSENEVALEARLLKLESQAKAVAKLYGHEAEDALEGLLQLGAEASDTPLEEYKHTRDTQMTAEEGERAARRTSFEQKLSSDLAAVQAAFPETKELKSITEISNFKRFCELSDMGLTPKEAYSAANPDAIRTSVAAAVKKQSLAGTKEHLRSVASKSAGGSTVKMSKSDKAFWKNSFGDGISDKELEAIYSSTAN